MRQPAFRLTVFILFIIQLSLYSPAQSVPPEPTSRTGQNESPVLEKGVPIEREFRRGQVHAYNVTLARGQYLKAVVREREIEFVVTLFDPANRKVIEVGDRLHGQIGQEHLLLLAESTGTYRFEIRSRFNCHALEKGECDGRYEIKIVDLREATPEDGLRVAAQLQYQQARKTEPGRRTEKLKEAGQLWKAVGETAFEAETLTVLAYEYYINFEHSKAIEYYNEALALWKSAGDHHGQAFTFGFLAWTYRRLGEVEKALDSDQQALGLWQAAGERRGEMETFYEIANCYQLLGQYQKALSHFEQGAQLARNLNHPQYKWLERIARVYEELGEKQKAKDRRLQALAEFQASGERTKDPRMLGRISLLYEGLGEHQKSADIRDEIAGYYREQNKIASEAGQLDNAGKAYVQMGEHKKASEILSISRLPFTRREAEGIFATAPPGSSLKALDFEANRDNVLKRDLSGYRIVHFATHGLLNSEHPELSGIVLSLVNEQGQPVDGFLRLNEIYNLNLSADMVVLSACQSALGKEIRGEGLIGLTRGFMYAGSPRVIASLWKVDDVATAEMMKIFYQKMLQERMRPAAALRAAKVEMWKQKRWNAPFYWAAFEIQGEWR